MPETRVLIHIVTWNDQGVIAPCIEALLVQHGFVLDKSLFIRITDNASSDSTCDRIQPLLRDGIELVVNSANLGFCAAHNQGVQLLLDRGFDAMLVLNPDVALAPWSLNAMLQGLDIDSRIGLVTPKLLRADSELHPIDPPTIDAAGMILTPAVRHFDRGSGEIDRGQFDESGDVFGATGACLLISRQCAEDLLIPETIPSDSVYAIYPQLRAGADQRSQLFDEAFFAYREDAEISWRAQRLGWRIRYLPQAVAYHVRVVLPERRSELPAEINRYSVRNRFLLQLYHWSWAEGLRSFIEGILLRNLVVIAGVLVRERRSLPALLDLSRLWKRSLAMRRYLAAREVEQR